MNVIERVERHADYDSYLFSAMVDGKPIVLCVDGLRHDTPPDSPVWECKVIKGDIPFDKSVSDENTARRILRHSSYIGYAPGDMDPATGRGICLDGDFELIELKAIVWWLENIPEKYFPDD